MAAISDQASDNVDEGIGRATMTGMLNLRNILGEYPIISGNTLKNRIFWILVPISNVI